MGSGCPVINEGNQYEQRGAEQHRREQEAPARAREHHEQRVGAGRRMQRARQLHKRDGGANGKGEAPRVDAEGGERAEPDERAQQVAADKAAGLRERALRECEGDDAGSAEGRHKQCDSGEIAEQAANQNGEKTADSGDKQSECFWE